MQLKPSAGGEDAEADPLVLFPLVGKLLLARVMSSCLAEVKEKVLSGGEDFIRTELAEEGNLGVRMCFSGFM